MASTLIGKFRVITTRYPMIKGMVSYAVLWPCGSMFQQLIEGKTLATFDWKRCLRFSIFGCFYVAPTLYGWVRLSSAMWPTTSFKVAVTKALVEQVSYGPFAMSSFYIGMNLLELNSFGDGVAELREKFFPTLKVGICIWPIVQTINFSLVPERNRVVVVSIVSVLWTTFLAYEKQLKLESKKLESQEPTNQPQSKYK